MVDNFPKEDFIQFHLNATMELGYKQVMYFNNGEYVGIGYVQGTLHEGFRQTTATNFLNPASKRPNLHVIKHALATKIVFRNGKAIGVEFVYENRTKFIAYSREEVIGSAGVIGSPQLLMVSGIGPAHHLSQLGIPLINDLPVGRNLHDHVAVPVFFRQRSDNIDVFRQKLDNNYQWAVHKSGIGINSVETFINTVEGSSAEYADIQIPISKFVRGNTADLDGYLKSFGLMDSVRLELLAENMKTDTLIIRAGLLQPKSRGTVELYTRSIFDKPNIDLNFLNHFGDIETLLRGIRYVERLAKTKAYREYVELIRLPLPDCDNMYEYRSDDYYRCYIRHMTITLYHPCGTCKMGPDTNRGAVVDHELRVKGVENSRVIDASVMPVIPSADINAATIMIGERGADFIKDDCRLEE